ncbi:Metallo-dependent phosphatase-like protein [Pholiota molesta]|nr:Metallo-dependent phosphatase-like protein [Pholiota molesta]
MPILNPTRRKAILYGFIPLMVIYLLYNFKLHHIIPSITSWPTEGRVVMELGNMARHKIMPWSFQDQDGKSTHHEEVDELDDEEEDADEEMLFRRVPFSRHIVAVGDLHGDMPNARKVLTFAGVVDDHGDWSGNVDYFVQTGDIIDRGDDTINLFLWMERLRAQAAHTGGTVLSHLGNHEWMNAIGDWRYVYPSELATFGSVAARQRMLSTGRIGRAWAANYTTASRLPLHPSLGPRTRHWDDATAPAHPYLPAEHAPLAHAALSFVHGGLSPSYPDLSPFPTRINALAESANGPLWYRGWAMEDEETVCAQVDEVLAKTGTRRMIMGHTPDFHNIKSRCNGKIIIIDTGISHAYGGVLSALSIHYSIVPIGDHASKRWREKEIVSALYEDRQEIIVTDEREIVGNFDHGESW